MLGHDTGITRLRDGAIDKGRGNMDLEAFGLAESKDDSLKALHFILQAWEDGAANGLAPEQMAYAALFTALSDLVAAYGEEAVAVLTTGLGARIKSGEFTLPRAAH
jgi:hypothetical protein